MILFVQVFLAKPLAYLVNKEVLKILEVHFFFDIARVAKYHQPKILFLENLENVRNFEKHDNGNTLETDIIAIRKDFKVREFNFPKPTYEQICLRDIILPDKETEKYIINREDMVINDSKIPNETLFNDILLKPIRVGYK